jgi:hypothetical protein
MRQRSVVNRGKYKSFSKAQKRWLKRRQAIEPTIGHVKHDHRTDAGSEVVHRAMRAACRAVRGWLQHPVADAGVAAPDAGQRPEARFLHLARVRAGWWPVWPSWAPWRAQARPVDFWPRDVPVTNAVLVAPTPSFNWLKWILQVRLSGNVACQLCRQRIKDAGNSPLTKHSTKAKTPASDEAGVELEY